MGISTKKTKQTTEQKEQSNATTTPVNPQWVTDTAQGMVGRVNALGQTDPASYIAGTNPLLQQAADRASNLGGWQDPLNTAMGMAQNAANPQTAQGYTATTAGDPATYSAPRLGNAAQANAQGYDAAQAEAVKLAELMKGKYFGADAQSVLDNGGIEQYVNPHLGALVDSTLANYDDEAGRVRAQQSAQAALNGAFGGSRYAILEAQTEADLARQRAQTEAGLRSDAYDFGANLAMYDTTNRQNVNLRNADARQNASFQNAQMGNQHNQYQAGLDQERNLFNTGQTNDASRFTADARNQADMFNTGQKNNMSLAQAQMEADAARYGADATNQFSMFNANAQNTAGQFNIGQANDMAKFNANQGLQAAGTLGQLANSYAGNAQQDTQIAAALGMNLQQLDQLRASAPLEFEKLMSQLYSSVPYGLFSGQQTSATSNMSGTNVTKSNPSLIDGIGQAISIGGKAASLFSDRRLKTNIVQVGAFPDGLGIYDFTYIWGEPARGVMADEVAALRPWALGDPVNGFATVNYGAL